MEIQLKLQLQEMKLNSLRKKIDIAFAVLGRFVYRHAWLTIIGVLLLLAPLILQLPQVKIDTSTESFLHKEDPALLAYNDFRDQFGRDELMILAFNPPEVFDLQFLIKLKEIHERLEMEVPYVEEVTSLINARATRGAEGELIVEELMENRPRSESELQAIKDFVLSNPTYKNLLISEDGKFTTMILKTVNYSPANENEDEFDFENFAEDSSAATGPAKREFLSDAENSEAVAAVTKIITEYQNDDFPIYFAGSNVITDYIKRGMQRDMLRFIRLTVLAIAILLFILFRRLSAVIWPLLVVILSLLATIGFMALTGTTLKLPTAVLPSFLLAVGIGDSVHILALFFKRFNAGESKESALISTIKHAGLPIVLTSLTTAGGLLSFAPSGIAPISELGLFAPFGVIIALFLSLTLLPALITVTRIRAHFDKGKNPTLRHHIFLDELIVGAGDLATRKPWWVLGVSMLLAIIAGLGILRLNFAHKPLEWLPEDEPVRISSEKIDHALKGSVSLEVVIDKKQENGWYDYEDLQKLDSLGLFAESLKNGKVYFGRAFSLADILKEIHKALNENSDEFYALPESRELIAQEFLLFENSGSDDLEDFTDSQFSKARIMLKAPFEDARSYQPVFKALKQELHQAFGTEAEIKLTGIMALFITTLHQVMTSMAVSYGYAFLIITILMMMIGHVRMGAISMIPNLLPILLTLGLMGWFGLTLDVFTLLIGSIALGLAVDDTIHFMHNFRHFYSIDNDVARAVHQTLEIAGRAMLFTTIVLTAGFFIFMFASMGNIFNFGLLTGFTISVALLADFLLAPALMQVIYGDKK